MAIFALLRSSGGRPAAGWCTQAHAIRDPKYDGSSLSDIYAAELRAKFVSALEKAVDAVHIHSDVLVDLTGDANPADTDASSPDAERAYRLAAIEGLRADQSFWQKIRSKQGIRWGTVQRLLTKYAPDFLEDDRERFDWAFIVVKDALSMLLGSEGIDYTIAKRADSKMWINASPQPASDPVEGQLVDAELPDDDEPPF